MCEDGSPSKGFRGPFVSVISATLSCSSRLLPCWASVSRVLPLGCSPPVWPTSMPHLLIPPSDNDLLAAPCHLGHTLPPALCTGGSSDIKSLPLPMRSWLSEVFPKRSIQTQSPNAHALAPFPALFFLYTYSVHCLSSPNSDARSLGPGFILAYSPLAAHSLETPWHRVCDRQLFAESTNVTAVWRLGPTA